MRKNLEQVLKLAQANEKQIKGLVAQVAILENNLKLADKSMNDKIAQSEKKTTDLIRRVEKSILDWEKTQNGWIKKIEGNVAKAVAGLNKRMDALHKSHEKRIVDNHFALSKKINDLDNECGQKRADLHNQITSWVTKNFDKKGIFN